MIATLVAAGCGPGASPTSTPASTGPTATPASGDTPPTPAPGALAPVSDEVLARSGYPIEKARQLIAQRMFLPGMTYGAGETPQYGGTASFSNKAELPNDDPTLTTSITQRNIIASITGNGSLVGEKRDRNDEPTGMLAESWTVSDDGKVWTFKLRPGIKWHDGDPLVAADVKFSFDLALSPPSGRRIATSLQEDLPNFDKIEVVDSMTVRLVFKEPSPHLLETLATEINWVSLKRNLAQKELDKGNISFGMAPLGWVGLGPYKYDQFIKGSTFKAVRYDGYWEKDGGGRSLPYLDSVQWTPIPDRAVALGAFRAGRLEAMSRGVGTSLDPREVEVVTRSLGDKVWYHRYPYLVYGVSMNVLKPPFDDIRARKAVNLYMDRDEGANKMQGGFAFSSGFLSPASWWHSHQYYEWPGFNPKTKTQDQAEAKRLMQEAGLVGAKTPISCRTDYLFMCEFEDQVLRGLGFAPSIELMDVNTQAEASRTMQYTVQAGGVCSDLQPIQCMASYTTDSMPNRYNDPKIDEWQRIIVTSLDPEVRRKALWDAERYFILEKAYNAPFWREEVLGPYRTYLKGSIVPGSRAHSNTDRATDWIDKSLKK